MSGYWDKAIEAALAARLLAREGQFNSAANRASYAMFNAARAVLAARTDLDMSQIRRHATVLQLFSLHVVKAGLVDASLGRNLNEVFELRAVADYDEGAIGPDDGNDVMRMMEGMLQAAASLLDREYP